VTEANHLKLYQAIQLLIIAT